MRVGLLVWNQFQVAHFAEIAAQFSEPDFIFIDRDRKALIGFDPAWLTPYGAFTRFIRETDLTSLDGQYDVILSQFQVPLERPWKKTRLVMCQYSMAKPKTTYNSRWLAADLGLVYGSYSASIIGQMCPTAQAGNSRFDPLFEGRLNPRIKRRMSDLLDPKKKTVLFLPTWGDLGAAKLFRKARKSLGDDFNILYRPHHMSILRESGGAMQIDDAITEQQLGSLLDPGLYFMNAADVVVSDMSGAIFDGLYCGKPVVLLGMGKDYSRHKKAEPTALEISQVDRIGRLVEEPDDLRAAIEASLSDDDPYLKRNAELVRESFAGRGGGAKRARDGIIALMEGRLEKPALARYVGPGIKGPLHRKAYDNALMRSAGASQSPKRRLQPGSLPWIAAKAPEAVKSSVQRHGLGVVRSLAGGAEKLGRNALAAKLHKQAGRWGSSHSLTWLAERAVEKRDAKTALKYYRRASAISAHGKREFVRFLISREDIFALGLAVEEWGDRKGRLRTHAFVQYVAAATQLRYSQMRQRGIAQSMQSYWQDTGRDLLAASRAMALRHQGLISLSAEVEHSSEAEAEKLATVIQFLGDERKYLELAALNESAMRTDWRCIAPNGDVIRVEDAPERRIYELSYMRNLCRPSQEVSEGMREFGVTGTRLAREMLMQNGFCVIPRFQGSARSSSMSSGCYPAITWHTTDVGLPGQIHLKVGSLPRHIVIDDAGYAGWSSFAHTPLHDLIDGVDQRVADEHFAQLSGSIIASGASKFKQNEDATLDVEEGFIFLPMQVVNDTVAAFADIDALNLLKISAEWAHNNGRRLVVKRHPKCASPEVALTMDELSRAGTITTTDAPVHDVLARADVVLTVNSGVGVEALLHGKPVISTGGSDYAPATLRARSPEELFERLERYPSDRPDMATVRRFIWAYTHRYMPSMDDETLVRQRLTDLIRRYD